MAYPQGEIIVPVVNLNGTSAERLLEGYREALDALRAARSAMHMISPHGRDYQTEERTVYMEAADQHQSRLRALDQMYQEIELIALAVQDQKHAKGR
jgi:hypothetical protein